MGTLYDTLEIKESASAEVIRAAYKSLSSKFHPDKNPGDAAAAKLMQQINNAYRVLRDPDLRRRYDDALRQARAQEQGAPPQPPTGGVEPPVPPSSPAAGAAAANKTSPSIWWPIIVAAIGVKMLGAVGAILGFLTYYWLEPKKGWIPAALISTAVGVGVAIGLVALADPPWNQTATHSTQIDNFLDGRIGANELRQRSFTYEEAQGVHAPSGRVVSSDNPFADPNYGKDLLTQPQDPGDQWWAKGSTRVR